MSMERLRDRIGGAWLEGCGGFRLAGSIDDVRRVAARMREAGARFVAIVGVPGRDGELVLHWHFDMAGTLLWIEVVVPQGGSLPSIADIYPGADWAERETRDYFAVDFVGRETTEPLMLRAGDAPGVLAGRQGGGA